MKTKLIIDTKMSKFLFRKKYVPGFFMINYNSTYAHSFNIRTQYIGLSAYLLAFAFSAWHSATQPAKPCGNESF
jgi:hypothetical protein